MANVFDPITQELVFKPEYLVDYPNIIRVPKGYMEGIIVHEVDLACNQQTMQSYYIDLELHHLFNIIDKPV